MRQLLLASVVGLVSTAATAQSISVEELGPLGDEPSLTITLGDAQSVEHGRADTGSLVELRGLDKVNGHTETLNLQVGASANLFGVMVTLHECRYPADNPTGDAYAYLTIRDPKSGVTQFQGWMVASSPALNALDHRRYDVWVLRCKSV